MEMDKLREILAKGVPNKETKEVSEDLAYLKKFAKQHLDKSVGCSFCNRHTLYRQLGEYLKAYDNQHETIH